MEGGGVGGGRREEREAVVERFRCLEEQLAAIENTARAVEGEFKDSNQVWEDISVIKSMFSILTVYVYL